VRPFGFSFVLFLRRRLATDDLKQHFAKEKVEDSWFVLSLDRQTDAEIALFLADDETLPKALEEQEKPLVTLVDMGSSYTASVLDTSLEVFDNYGETSAEISSPPSVALPATRPSEGGAEQVRQIAVRVCKDDDGSMHFGQATITSSESEASSGEKEELFRLREEVSRLSQQLNRVTDLQAQIDMLKTVFSGTRVDDSLLGAAASSSGYGNRFFRKRIVKEARASEERSFGPDGAVERAGGAGGAKRDWTERQDTRRHPGGN
jgi:hypothetical protein